MAFQSNAFQGSGFQIARFGGAVDNGWLGGTFKDPYFESEKRKAQLARIEALKEAQDEVIRIKMEQQELRLQELAAIEARDKQTARQLAAVNRRKAELADEVIKTMALIEQFENEKKLRNNEALMILSMAFPWLKIGGETMH